MIKLIPNANKDFHFSHPFKKIYFLWIAQINKSNDQINSLTVTALVVSQLVSAPNPFLPFEVR